MQWKPIPGYEGLYEVSKDGQVRGLNRIVQATEHTRKVVGVILKRTNHKGHYSVILSKKDERKRINIEKLLKKVFI